MCLWTPRMRRQPGQRRRSLTVFLAALDMRPRSRDLPVAFTDGSAKEDINKMEYDWTAPGR